MIGLSNAIPFYPVLVILLTCHILSDYQLQSPAIASRKDRDLSALLTHIFFVGLPLLVVFFFFPTLWWQCLLIFLSHALIDCLKPRFQGLFQAKTSAVFLVDQFLHLAIIVILASFSQVTLGQLPLGILKAFLFVLLVSKPSNIVFRICFGKFQPEVNSQLDTISGAGAMIGFLERVIIGICIAYGQFALIGLVFTAKSIARYNKIAESPAFAEYYLIGSLYSILSAFVAAWICIL